MFKRFTKTTLACLVATAACVRAADITVTGEADTSGKQTISLTAIRHDSSPQAREFLGVLRNDLTRSGWFIPVETPSASVVVQGQVNGGASFYANLNVSWLAGQRQFNWSKSAQAQQIRDAAHALADEIVYKVTGNPPMASSKIIMVGRRGGTGTEIYACDYDGARLQQITNDKKLCMSPTWVPGANEFLYTSWLTGGAAVYKISLDTKVREMISAQPGMNHGAVTSPDGQYIALILSRSGGVDMYIRNTATKKLTRLTNSKSVNESSPSWSPDGNSIVYVSDENRSPQVHIMTIDKQSRRAVHGMRESVAPEWGPNNLVTFCGRDASGRYKIYVMDPARDPRTTAPKLVSPDDGADYEDPSWAPDGRHIVATRTVNYKRSLVILDTLGDAAVPLLTLDGEWYLPNWSHNFKKSF